MTLTKEDPAVQRATTPVALYVGTVMGYYSRFQAARIDIPAGTKIVIGDRLRFGPRPEAKKARTRTIVVTRLERRRHSLLEAGPGLVAVFTGHPWIGEGTPVYRMVSADPIE